MPNIGEASGGLSTGAHRTLRVLEVGVLLVAAMIIGLAIVLAAVILSAAEDQQQRQRRADRDYDLRKRP